MDDASGMESPCVWRRTWPDVSHDFTAKRDGKPIGRVYRHTDGKRWQWFDLIGGQQGIEDARHQAADKIRGDMWRKT